jgi:hypothetical protein
MNLFITLLENVNKSRTSANNVSQIFILILQSQLLLLFFFFLMEMSLQIYDRDSMLWEFFNLICM